MQKTLLLEFNPAAILIIVIGLPNAADYSSTWESSPPSPKDSLDQSNDYWDTMIALKKVSSGDVTQVVSKNTWSSGNIYDVEK